MKKLLPLLLCLLLLCACGRSEKATPVGTWVNAGQYTEGREFVETMTILADGRLSVHLDYQGRPYADLTGSWRLEGETMTFTMDDGTVRVYTVAVSGDELTLKNNDRTVVYARRSAQS